MFITLLVSIIVILVFVASILFLPSVAIGKHNVKVYSLIPLIGAIILVVCERVGFFYVVERFLENTSVNPLKILVLFLSMTTFSLILEQTGFFSFISIKVLEKAGNNQFVIFFSFYFVISLLTVFTSNDIIILTFTPFICHFCRSANISAMPYLFMEFVAANTWSLLLIIGNPTNIYICGAFGVDFIEYVKVMALPTAFAGITSLAVMLLLFYKKLKKPMERCEEHGEITDMPVMIISLVHLSLCVVALAVSQYIGVEMWLISLAVSVSEVLSVAICQTVRKKKYAVISKGLSGMPFEIIPFIVGMFIIVLALESSGITEALHKFLEPMPDIFTYGYLSFFAANVVNNIPMSVLFSKILSSGGSAALEGVYATVIGSNIGAFLTPVGALAGIMWSNLLRKNGIKISFARFLKYGAVIGIPSVSAAIVALFVIM
ncbi:MAG: hypothetical protein J6Q77_00730 [Clostridia bacterium]|nr:hypothetical protein [Clostridia bacterium]